MLFNKTSIKVYKPMYSSTKDKKDACILVTPFVFNLIGFDVTLFPFDLSRVF